MGNQKLNQQDLVYEVEWFLRQNYEFRHNVLSNKTEYREIDETVPSSAWMTVTSEPLKSSLKKLKWYHFQITLILMRRLRALPEKRLNT